MPHTAHRTPHNTQSRVTRLACVLHISQPSVHSRSPACVPGTTLCSHHVPMRLASWTRCTAAVSCIAGHTTFKYHTVGLSPFPLGTPSVRADGKMLTREPSLARPLSSSSSSHSDHPARLGAFYMLIRRPPRSRTLAPADAAPPSGPPPRLSCSDVLHAGHTSLSSLTSGTTSRTAVSFAQSRSLTNRALRSTATAPSLHARDLGRPGVLIWVRTLPPLRFLALTVQRSASLWTRSSDPALNPTRCLASA